VVDDAAKVAAKLVELDQARQQAGLAQVVAEKMQAEAKIAKFDAVFDSLKA
jgi:hypothetical protein